jgi:PAS domain-containing protein
MFCKKPLGTVEDSDAGDGDISHGVCSDCVPLMYEGRGEQFDAFLDSLPGPILVVDKDGRVVAANSLCRALLPATDEPRGRLGGEVFQCKYASLPGGCGRTKHCKSCAIRLTVTHTFETGDPCTRVPAVMDLMDISGDQRTRFLISTRRRGDVIQVRIEDIQPVDEDS